MVSHDLWLFIQSFLGPPAVGLGRVQVEGFGGSLLGEPWSAQVRVGLCRGWHVPCTTPN